VKYLGRFSFDFQGLRKNEDDGSSPKSTGKGRQFLAIGVLKPPDDIIGS